MTEIKPTATETALAKFALPRMGWWLYAAIAAIAFVLYSAFTTPTADPALASHHGWSLVKMYAVKFSIISAAFWMGYVGCNHLEKGKRPHEVWNEAKEAKGARKFELEQLASQLQWRRAVVVVGTMLAFALAL